jgi:hypothetical protein
VRGFDLVQAQCAGERDEYGLGHGALSALFQAAVVVDAEPREHRQLLAAQSGNPSWPGERLDPGLGGGKPVPACTQERAEV